MIHNYDTHALPHIPKKIYYINNKNDTANSVYTAGSKFQTRPHCYTAKPWTNPFGSQTNQTNRLASVWPVWLISKILEQP